MNAHHIHENFKKIQERLSYSYDDLPSLERLRSIQKHFFNVSDNLKQMVAEQIFLLIEHKIVSSQKHCGEHAMEGVFFMDLKYFEDERYRRHFVNHIASQMLDSGFPKDIRITDLSDVLMREKRIEVSYLKMDLT